jgi:hypothetical protein
MCVRVPGMGLNQNWVLSHHQFQCVIYCPLVKVVIELFGALDLCCGGLQVDEEGGRVRGWEFR